MSASLALILGFGLRRVGLSVEKGIGYRVWGSGLGSRV